MLFYVVPQSLQSSQEFLDQNLFNWVIKTMQSFTTFDNSLFQQIWLDLSEFSCKYESSNSFFCHVNKEFVKTRTQLRKELEKTENCNIIALSLDE